MDYSNTDFTQLSIDNLKAAVQDLTTQVSTAADAEATALAMHNDADSHLRMVQLLLKSATEALTASVLSS